MTCEVDFITTLKALFVVFVAMLLGAGFGFFLGSHYRRIYVVRTRHSPDAGRKGARS